MYSQVRVNILSFLTVLVGGVRVCVCMIDPNIEALFKSLGYGTVNFLEGVQALY